MIGARRGAARFQPWLALSLPRGSLGAETWSVGPKHGIYDPLAGKHIAATGTACRGRRAASLTVGLLRRPFCTCYNSPQQMFFVGLSSLMESDFEMAVSVL